ncbi:killer cell lectin-like receptor subfamily B member 1A [Microtus ochrogaster]|uniref:Killer cell lectin-like receptor subfamily B member 1A n=1 Tax=Microtus ochrogaster TaxID=79684 RepID=A0ABM1AU95_MICOH|nr:killer cell lectin-like receptor subfamily B member 1A [Microtus ochrogaster]
MCKLCGQDRHIKTMEKPSEAGVSGCGHTHQSIHEARPFDHFTYGSRSLLLFTSSLSHLPFAMGTPRVYFSLKTPTTPGPLCASPPSRPSDACRCPRSHRLALKLSCAGLVLLLLTVVGLSVLVRVLIQKPSIEKCRVDIPRIVASSTESPIQLTCSNDWRPHREKCIQFSQENGVWKEGLSNCTRKGATLLLIQDQEELRFVKDSIKERGNSFWIGLNYSLPDKNWRWINGSTLSSDVFNIIGDAERNSCVIVSKGNLVSENCNSDNKWICQKDPKCL